MDFLGENLGDSLDINDIHLLTSMMPLGIPAAPMTVTDPSAVLNTQNIDIQDPHVVIVEQPQPRGFRFRYECEGPSHGGLQGEKTEKNHKTYPSIRIENYDGPAQIEVSLVTDENPPKIHAHKLVGKNCIAGVCKLEINSTASDISFPNLCILHVTRRQAGEVLLNRILEDIKLNKKLKSGGLTPEPSTSEENLNVKKQAQDQARSMALNVVRLQFRVFLPNAEGQYLNMLPLVVSQPIYDSKSPGASSLKICRMDKFSGCCTGNEEVFLLCEKVQKEDISVRFVENNHDGTVKWEAYGNFSPLDVHRQFAIVFKTPAYYNPNIDRTVTVMIMLQRKSDGEVSEPKSFTYYPQNRDKDFIVQKKRKRFPLDIPLNAYPSHWGPDNEAPGPVEGKREELKCSVGDRPDNVLRNHGGPGHVVGDHAVIMPNGNVEQLNVLPTPVEQAVKEEMAQCAETTIRPEVLLHNSSVNWFNPMMWDRYFNDLEIDSAPSLRYSSLAGVERAGHIPVKQPFIHSDTASSIYKYEKDLSSLFEKELDREKDTPIEPVSKSESTHSGSQQETSVQLGTEETGPSNMNDCFSLDTNHESVGQSVEKVASEAEMHDADIKTQKEESETEHPSEQSEEKTEHSKSVLSSSCLNETTSSERLKSEEAFLEPSSLKEKYVAKETKKADSKYPAESECKEEDEDTKETNIEPMKVAQAAVNHIIQQVTTQTVSALRDFAETGDARYVLLVHRHLTGIKNENGDLLIHLAVINNQTSSLCQLLDVMMSVPSACHYINSFNFLRQTALHLAAIMQQSYNVELLLHAGADPSLVDRNGNTPAHLAVLNNSVEALHSLVKYLRPGVSAANPFPELDYLNSDGFTPVHLAVHSDNVDMLRMLVYGGANVDMPDGKSGRTAIHHAVELDNLPVAVFLLMEANADVNVRCFDGNTPLHIACCRGLVGVVALLKTVGALNEVANEDSLPENSQECEETSGKCGLFPRDCVAGKNSHRILTLLIGEPDPGEWEERLPTSDDDDFEDEDDVVDTSTSILQKSAFDIDVAGSTSPQSGNKMMSKKLCEELGKLLDPENSGKDVFTLASLLGYESIVPALEVMGCSGSSPTMFLLDYHRSYGSMEKLRPCLKEMERDDALQLLDKEI